MNASDLGYDNKKIILAVSSAGAHLVAMCVLDKLKIKILGNILVSGIYDIEPLIDTSIDEALSLSKDEAYRNSPLNFSLKNFPPTIVAWGENETEQFKKQSKILVNKLIDEGVPVRSLEVIGKNHFDIILDLANFDKELGKFLKEGSLYKGFKPVLWSTVEKTALADAEVEYQDHKSDTIYTLFKKS